MSAAEFLGQALAPIAGGIAASFASYMLYRANPEIVPSFGGMWLWVPLVGIAVAVVLFQIEIA